MMCKRKYYVFWDWRGVHRVLVGKAEGKRPLGETQT
jgi:hypothetical protein